MPRSHFTTPVDGERLAASSGKNILAVARDYGSGHFCHAALSAGFLARSCYESRF